MTMSFVERGYLNKLFLTCAVVAALCGPAHAQTIWYVDDDCSPPGLGTEAAPYCTIQAGVDNAQDGDTVLVAPGIYTGDGNRDISLFGKAITLKSTDGPDVAIMDIQGGPAAIHRGFFLVHGETQETSIEGFAIKNGYLIGVTDGVGDGGGGAGIYIRNSSPTIRNSVIMENYSAALSPPFPVDGRGGGVYIDGSSSAIIEQCIIADNIADRRGGGMYISDGQSSVVVRNCLITGNSSGLGGTYSGGGVHNGLTATTVLNTAIVNNSATGSGGGLHNEGGQLFMSNCILWDNEAISGEEIFLQGPVVTTVQYSSVQGGFVEIAGCCNYELDWGPGNIDDDPLFVNPAAGDYHFRHGSPCVDAGDNMIIPPGMDIDLDGKARFVDDPHTPDTGNPDGVNPIVDMGPYEFDPDDCNNNDTPDAEDISSGTSADCNDNAIPDDCEADCNGNDQADDCDLTAGISEDCDGSGIPDECESACSSASGPAITLQPQSQDVEVGGFAIFQVNGEGLSLEYQWRKDGAKLCDTARILGSQGPMLGIFDLQPADAGDYDCVVTDLIDPGCSTSDPATLAVLVPCPADINGDAVVNASDLAVLLGAWGPNPDNPADLNGDDVVDSTDLALLLGSWGTCSE